MPFPWHASATTTAGSTALGPRGRVAADADDRLAAGLSHGGGEGEIPTRARAGEARDAPAPRPPRSEKPAVARPGREGVEECLLARDVGRQEATHGHLGTIPQACHARRECRRRRRPAAVAAQEGGEREGARARRARPRERVLRNPQRPVRSARAWPQGQRREGWRPWRAPGLTSSQRVGGPRAGMSWRRPESLASGQWRCGPAAGNARVRAGGRARRLRAWRATRVSGHRRSPRTSPSSSAAWAPNSSTAPRAS